MPPADPQSVLDRAADPPDAVLRWADRATHGDDGVADVYLPDLEPALFDAAADRSDSAAAPVLVALHGGFWRHQYDRRGLRPLAVALRALGRVVVLPEYRRTGGRGGWPATFDDVRSLRARLPGLLAGVVPDRVAAGPPTVVGHSAGGHLALWWALDAPPDQLPARVVALAPAADLARAHADRLGDGAVEALLGGGPRQVPEAYAVADVAARLRAGERPGCRLTVLQGSDDLEVPARYNEGLTGVDLRLLPGVEHFGLIDPRAGVWPEVLEHVR